MIVVIRVDASIKIGSGHVMRCISLAQNLKKNFITVEFLCRETKGHLISYITNMGFTTHVLNLKPLSKNNDINNSSLHHRDWLETTQKQDAQDCKKILKNMQVDWLIVDHYSIDKTWQSEVMNFCKKLMVIDDLADREHMCDVLLDYSYNGNLKRYNTLVPKYCKLLLGLNFCLLRSEFLQWRKYSQDNHKDGRLRKILITMGGYDKANITGKILENVNLLNLPVGVSLTVVMGSFSPHIHSIRKQVENTEYDVAIKENVSNMAELISNSDLVISAAGSTIWEICCLGVPSILVIAADNQLQSIQEFNKVGLSLTNPSQESFILDLKYMLCNFNNNSNAIWKDIVDGRGVDRVTKVLLKN